MPPCHRGLFCYHYSNMPTGDELTLKDGLYDHSIDAIRYSFINHTNRILKIIVREH
ncbi:MAG: hypothetical protein JW749_06880 [Sedimentisphaerales bacterium]|nr:hypothetical protein [Sedimentisphaerales bacterium]